MCSERIPAPSGGGFRTSPLKLGARTGQSTGKDGFILTDAPGIAFNPGARGAALAGG